MTNPEPEYVYDPNSWTASYEWGYRDELMNDEPCGEIKKLSTLIEGPPIFAARIVLTRDGHGDPDKTEIQWFDTEEAAEAAVAKAEAPST